MKQSFCFVLNPLEVTGNTPVELIANHFLQKADAEQTRLIRNELHRNYSRHYPHPAYEYEWSPEAKDGSRSSHQLTQDKFRYWVVTFERTNIRADDLQLATNLLKNDLDFGFHFVYHNEGENAGIISGHSNISSFFESHESMFGNTGNGALVLDAVELSVVKGYVEAIKSTEQAHLQIHTAVKDFTQLKSLPRKSNLVVLGYFAIIESLVTHDPKDDFDSLNHQISTKMSLLSKKFERQLDYKGCFGETSHEQAWKKLYGYRSALAHGTPVDFKTKFQILKNQFNANAFLKEAVKLTLLFAMEQPEFLADLKKC